VQDKATIHARDVQSMTPSPVSAIVSYKPDIGNVWLMKGPSNRGLFVAGYRPSAEKPIEELHGETLRVLRRENNGEWKFARGMVLLNSR
jgi:hypothetical protein